MPLYTYRCRTCGFSEEVFDEITNPSGAKDFYDSGALCVECVDNDRGANRLARVFSFSATQDVIGDGYFDHGVGAFVSSKKQLDDINKAKSEAHTLRTGVETNFVAHRIEDAAPRMGPEV